MPAILPGRLRAAILDLDGTLVDTLGDFSAAIGRMLRELGLPPVSAETVAGFIGKAIPPRAGGVPYVKER